MTETLLPLARPADRHFFGVRRPLILGAFALALLLVSMSPPGRADAATLLAADFDGGTGGFTYQDDAFLGTSQPAYASGVREANGGYGGTGGLRVSLGGIDAATVNGMSGAWSYTFNLPAPEYGLVLAFRYRLEQTANYEYDEFSRILASMDGALLGRGAKAYIDHIGGDGSSAQGNSNTFQPTTDWQLQTTYLGELPAGTHTLRLGGYNNRKNATDESTTIMLDDVSITSGNPSLPATDAQIVVDRLDIESYKSTIETLAAFGDRCRMTTCPGSPANSFLDAQEWVADELAALGYSPEYHNSTWSGSSVSNLHATKVGTVRPDQMYLVSAHLDGRGGGGGADDDASGVAVALEVARALAPTDIETDVSVRFVFWDKEEIGLYGSNAYVTDRRVLQGIEDPPGSGLYPEPTWLGLLQHDMVLYDHGAGTAGGSQSVYADLDVEWRAGTTKEADSRALAQTWRYLNGHFSTDYPATAYDYSTNSDDTPFHPYVASISVRENRRSLTSGSNAEWINPNYHTATDLYVTYSEADFLLGLNAAQATLGAVAQLAGARIEGRPTANALWVTTAKNVAVGVTLSGTDPDDQPLTFAVVSNPSHGLLSGTPPNLTYTPNAGYVGGDSFTFAVNDGTVSSAPATVSIAVAAASFGLPFTDDLETDKGWVTDFYGTDTADSGAWERGDPGDTDQDGPKQLGTTVSGARDLVTGARAGGGPNRFDLDNGVSSLVSPALALPTGQNLTLTFSYYLAHARNSSPHDYFRVSVVGEMPVVVLEERGAGVNRNGAWQTATVILNAFAGQTVTLQIEAADLGRASLVEAAVDDVALVASPLTAPILDAGFDGGAEGFVYADDPFRGSGQPDYSAGDHLADGGHDGGALRIHLGGVDIEIIDGMSGGWQKAFSLATASTVNLSFWYSLTQSPDYEPEEYSEALVAVDGALIGYGSDDFIARIHGNGNGGIEESTGWGLFSVTLPELSAGSHTLSLGGYNNRKSFTNETTDLRFDDALIIAVP